MADYERYGGSKEKIGIILSSTDNSKFVIEKAKVEITGYPSATASNPRPGLTAAIRDEACTIDSKDEATSHRVEYVWEVKSQPGLWTAEFSMTLPDGQVVVRAVTVSVK